MLSLSEVRVRSRGPVLTTRTVKVTVLTQVITDLGGEPVAEAILDTLTSATPAPQVPESGRTVFPLPADAWTRTSGFGIRVHPVTGKRKLHTGLDLAATAGTPIRLAVSVRSASRTVAVSVTRHGAFYSMPRIPDRIPSIQIGEV